MGKKIKVDPSAYNVLPFIQVNETGYIFRFCGEDYTGPHYATHNDTISFGKTHALRVVYHYLKDLWGLPIIKYNSANGDFWYRYKGIDQRGKADPSFRAWTQGLHHLMARYEFTPDQLQQIKEMFR